MILVEPQCQFVSIQSSGCLLDFWKIYYVGNCVERVTFCPVCQLSKVYRVLHYTIQSQRPLQDQLRQLQCVDHHRNLF